MLYVDPAAKTHDRFGFMLTMAIALHVAVILGVGFAMQVPKAPSATRLDITLSNYATDEAVENADFLAQTNQKASGTESKKTELSTTQLAPIDSSVPQEVSVDVKIPKQQVNNVASLDVIDSTAKSSFTVMQQKTDSQKANQFDGQDQQLLLQMQIASLNAKLAEEQQRYAHLPKVRRVTSVSTRSAIDAAYLYEWQKRIEIIGNQHYPAKARAQHLEGDVQVLVAINSDGSLEQVKLLQSSGHAVLDQAALRIVRLASPYKPFSLEMKKNTDRLEIIRTWQFRQNHLGRLQ